MAKRLNILRLIQSNKPEVQSDNNSPESQIPEEPAITRDPLANDLDDFPVFNITSGTVLNKKAFYSALNHAGAQWKLLQMIDDNREMGKERLIEANRLFDKRKEYYEERIQHTKKERERDKQDVEHYLEELRKKEEEKNELEKRHDNLEKKLLLIKIKLGKAKENYLPHRFNEIRNEITNIIGLQDETYDQAQKINTKTYLDSNIILNQKRNRAEKNLDEIKTKRETVLKQIEGLARKSFSPQVAEIYSSVGFSLTIISGFFLALALMIITRQPMAVPDGNPLSYFLGEILKIFSLIPWWQSLFEVSALLITVTGVAFLCHKYKPDINKDDKEKAKLILGDDEQFAKWESKMVANSFLGFWCLLLPYVVAVAGFMIFLGVNKFKTNSLEITIVAQSISLFASLGLMGIVYFFISSGSFFTGHDTSTGLRNSITFLIALAVFGFLAITGVVLVSAQIVNAYVYNGILLSFVSITIFLSGVLIAFGLYARTCYKNDSFLNSLIYMLDKRIAESSQPIPIPIMTRIEDQITILQDELTHIIESNKWKTEEISPGENQSRKGILVNIQKLLNKLFMKADKEKKDKIVLEKTFELSESEKAAFPALEALLQAFINYRMVTKIKIDQLQREIQEYQERKAKPYNVLINSQNGWFEDEEKYINKMRQNEITRMKYIKALTETYDQNEAFISSGFETGMWYISRDMANEPRLTPKINQKLLP